MNSVVSAYRTASPFPVNTSWRTLLQYRHCMIYSQNEHPCPRLIVGRMEGENLSQNVLFAPYVTVTGYTNEEIDEFTVELGSQVKMASFLSQKHWAKSDWFFFSIASHYYIQTLQPNIPFLLTLVNVFVFRCLQKLTLTYPGDLCSTLFTVDCYLPHLCSLVLRDARWDPTQLHKWTEFGARTPNLKELSILCYTRFHLPAYEAQPKLWEEHIPAGFPNLESFDVEGYTMGPLSVVRMFARYKAGAEYGLKRFRVKYGRKHGLVDQTELAALVNLVYDLRRQLRTALFPVFAKCTLVTLFAKFVKLFPNFLLFVTLSYAKMWHWMFLVCLFRVCSTVSAYQFSSSFTRVNFRKSHRSVGIV